MWDEEKVWKEQTEIDYLDRKKENKNRFYKTFFKRW